MQFYDSVYQSLDCPDDYIIENNHLLDQWFEAKIKEQDSERQSRRNKQRGGQGKSAFDHQEVTIYY
jgi:hypothetical protein